MKVLMFGWEFPSYLSGGLGTACFGLTKGLARHNVDITFVLPRLQSEVVSSHVKLLGANRVRVRVGTRKIKAFKERVKLLEIDSPIMPYLSGDEYQILMAIESVAAMSYEVKLHRLTCPLCNRIRKQPGRVEPSLSEQRRAA